MSAKNKIKTVSIIIPTYNAGNLLIDVLSAIYTQTLKPYEVIVIDSSSTDLTPQNAKKYPVKFISIPKEEFGHGKTRNLGIEKSAGDYVVFLTQDATPRNNEWLEELIIPLEKNRNIIATYSRQIARNEAVPMEKFFYRQMYPAISRLVNKKDITSDSILFSNASSAIKKQVIMSNPFAIDILMSEDQEWAGRMLSNGYSIYYASKSQVTHSHNTRFSNLFKRYFDFGVSHSEITKKNYKSPRLKGGVKHVKNEIKYLIKNKQYSWLIGSINYNSAKLLGLLLGRNNRFIPKILKRKFTSYYVGYWK